MKLIEIPKTFYPSFLPIGLLLISYFIHVIDCLKDNSIPCKKSGSCSCIIEDPKNHSSHTEFSLSPFNNKDGTPKITTYSESWIYTLNLCNGFTTSNSACKDVCGCQTSQSYGSFPLAPGNGPSSFDYNIDTKVLTLKYKDVSYQSEKRSLVVSLKYKIYQYITVSEDSSSLTFNVFIHSPKFVGHPVKVNNPDEEKGKSLSVGSIIVIVFFVVLSLYLVAGILFMKFKIEASGKELIPNLGFWTSLPGLVKDGCVFFGGKVKKTCCRVDDYQEI